MLSSKWRVGRLLSQLLLVGAINKLVFRVRFFYFVHVKRSLRSHEDEKGVIRHDYSLQMLLRGQTSNRPLKMIRPMSVLDRKWSKMKVLSIGCRYETELLYLVAHGCEPANVRGLDMLSYSPWVDVGNMHALPYADDSWDAVVMAWVIAYSDDPRLAAREAVRVARNGGLIAVSLSYVPADEIAQRAEDGTLIGIYERRQTVAGLLELFEGHVDKIFFQHDTPDPAAQSWCGVIFSVQKTSATPS